jgi:hypothetical protein
MRTSRDLERNLDGSAVDRRLQTPTNRSHHEFRNNAGATSTPSLIPIIGFLVCAWADLQLSKYLRKFFPTP